MAKFQLNYEANDYDANKKNGIPYKSLIEWSETLIIAVLAFFIVMVFLFRQASITGDSMQPSLSSGDKLAVSSIGYTPQKGDVVVVDGKGLNVPVVSRIAAVGGDTLAVSSEGKLTVNGALVEEGYIFGCEDVHPFSGTVPEGCYFVLNDNRGDTSDSRSDNIGYVTEEEIAGKAVFRMWPVISVGKVK
ncbi:MAG: signal peptidase I [Huintestinicola sp.]